MIFHSMNVVRDAVHHLNPCQVPVIAMDQPLYAIAKRIQWTISTSHGEDKMVIMFGGLHIEMAALKLLGDLLAGSGWTSALVDAGIATSGTADSFIKVSHVTKTRHAHQVNAAALYMLLNTAYKGDFSNQLGGENSLSFEEWCCKKKSESRQFNFWYQVLLLTVDVLLFIRSIREADFALYIDSLKNIAPWFFALDHTNYSRYKYYHISPNLVGFVGGYPFMSGTCVA